MTKFTGILNANVNRLKIVLQVIRSGMEPRPYAEYRFVGCGFHAAPLNLLTLEWRVE